MVSHFFKRYILLILSILGLTIALIAVFISMRKPPPAPIPFPPPTPPFEHFIAAQGIVESSTSDISIGTPFSEIVREVFVYSGDFVEKDAPLFQLDTTIRQARYEDAKAALEVAISEYQKQLDLPRDVDVAPFRALVGAAEAEFLSRTMQFEIVDKIQNPKAVSRDEFFQKKYSALSAKYQLEEAQNNLEKILAGAWEKDLEIYRREVKKAERNLEIIEKEIALCTIRAPFSGVVLQVNINQSEYAQATTEAVLADPLIVFGKLQTLMMKVEIDQEEVWRIIEGAPAEAYFMGNSSIHFPIHFERLQPFLTPKVFLTGATSERVDTRVLKIIYTFDRQDFPVYPGLLMDVYLEAKPNPEITNGGRK